MEKLQAIEILASRPRGKFHAAEIWISCGLVARFFLSFGLSRSRQFEHFVGGQRYGFPVTPNVERQSQTSMFVDDLFNGFFECHLSTFF